MSGMQMSGLPVSALPVSGLPVSALPVSGLPVSALPMSALPMSGLPVSGRSESHTFETAIDELSSSLDYETALEAVADALVPAIADACVVELLERGELRTIAVTHAGPSKRAWARRFRADDAPSLDVVTPTARVIASGDPLLVTNLREADLTSYAQDAEHLEQLGRLELSSLVCAPIVVTGTGAIGTLTLLSSASRRTFDAEDLRLARQLGRETGTAIGHARAHRAAEEALRARDDFLAIAGHELRTPLATIVLQLESLKRALVAGILPPKAATERVQKMLEQTNRLNRLIDALLDVTRVSAGRLILEPEPMNLDELVRDVAERFAEEAVRANVALTIAADSPCEGAWDPRRLDQVISNLLSNAIKYGEGSPVLVTCERAGDLVRVRVRDHGMGVALADMERIFDRFERAPPAARDRGGFGLGLWIAREIVTAHGGRITLESTQGEGSTFSIELPTRPRPPR